MDAPSALKGFPAPPQTLQTTPGSLRSSHNTSTMPTPNGAGFAAQDQSHLTVSLQHPSNDASNPSSSKPLGERSAPDLMPLSNLDGLAFTDVFPECNACSDTTMIPQSGNTMKAGSANALSGGNPGLDGQWRHDTPSGGLDFSIGQVNIDSYDGVFAPETLSGQAWTEDWLNGDFRSLDEGDGTMQQHPSGRF